VGAVDTVYQHWLTVIPDAPPTMSRTLADVSVRSPHRVSASCAPVRAAWILNASLVVAGSATSAGEQRVLGIEEMGAAFSRQVGQRTLMCRQERRAGRGADHPGVDDACARCRGERGGVNCSGQRLGCGREPREQFGLGAAFGRALPQSGALPSSCSDQVSSHSATRMISLASCQWPTPPTSARESKAWSRIIAAMAHAPAP